MKYPNCKGDNVLTKDTRHPADHETKRRRVCQDCGWCFYTVEIPVDKYKQLTQARFKLMQITKGGRGHD